MCKCVREAQELILGERVRYVAQDSGQIFLYHYHDPEATKVIILVHSSGHY